MLISLKVENDAIVPGNVWLITPDNITGLPIGMRYAIMSTDPSYFPGGAYAIVTDSVEDLIQYGATNSDNKYPNGQPVYETGDILTWITVIDETLIDPLPAATDEQIYISAQLRSLITPTTAQLSQIALNTASHAAVSIVAKATVTAAIKV
jgi:hypothetical protein